MTIQPPAAEFSPELRAEMEAVDRIDAVPTILDVVCRTTGMGFAAVARVTGDRWIACKVLDGIDFGLKQGGELKVDTTICHDIRSSHEPVIINHVEDDDTYRNHPTPAMYRFQSYISVPILLKDGQMFGTLCAIDPRPARLTNPETVGMFKLFAELIASHLDADQELQASQNALLEEQKFAELREQFIAVLGHDLRNPVAAIDSGTKLLLRHPQADKALLVISMMQSSVMRMRGLIDNVLDFARARLGEGIELNIDVTTPLEPTLRHVVAELQASQPDRSIETEFVITGMVPADHAKIGQLLSNLLSNALTHGADAAPVRVRGVTHDDVFEVSVANSGTPISPSLLSNLFQPFFRGKTRASHQGLGLGLYIASEVARAHGGTLEASSNPAETRFTFRMPLPSNGTPTRLAC